MRNFLQKMKDTLSHKHVKTAAGAAANAALVVGGKVHEVGSDALDLIARKSTDDAVREHILQQGRYNDILALKLDEALRRIDALEKVIRK